MTEDKKNADGEAENTSGSGEAPDAAAEEAKPIGSGVRAEPVEGGGEAGAQAEEGEGQAGGDRVAELEAEVARLKDQSMRALAEAENTRRRAEKERQDNAKYAAAGLARDILGVADNLRRALEAVDPETRANESVDALVTGVEMTEKMLLEALDKHGIQKIDPLGEPFDYNYHQAMMEVDTDEVEGGHVAQVMQPGYVLHDRLIRPAMVAVAKKKKGGDAGGDQPKVDTSA